MLFRSLNSKAKPTITQILQTQQLSLHLVFSEFLLSERNENFSQILWQLLVFIDFPLTFKNLAEFQGRGAQALESLPWAYELTFMRLMKQSNNPAEGDRTPIEVVENAGNLESDMTRTSSDAGLCA